MDENKLALVNAEDLSLVQNNSLNANQLALILKKTPSQYVKTRPAKGGGTWEYVTGGYVKKCLNLMFGWDWNFEILDEKILFGEAVVKGKLTCRSHGTEIVKMQFGNKDIIYKREADKDGNRIPLSIGNDLKAAATDCLKKCAAEIGIAADIYNKEDFKEVKVALNNTLPELIEIYEGKKDLVSPEEQINFERIIENKEKLSYKKAIDFLNKL